MDGTAAREILESAALFLEFLDSTRQKNCTYGATEDASLKLTLVADEAELSKSRGGDGVAADLRGGTVSVFPQSGAVGVGGQRQLSFCARLRVPSGEWHGPIIRDFDEDGRLRFRLFAEADSLVLDLYTDFADQSLRMEVPLAVIGRSSWHDVVGRYSGANVELFVDGVLVDEEWPIGALTGHGSGQFLIGGRDVSARERQKFAGLIDHVAVWDRALREDEITAISGGPEGIRGRGWSLSSFSRVQYCEAHGGGLVGDCMPFFHDGVYHFYYLLDRRSHRSKFGLGAHQWAHASSKDLRHWQRHSLAIAITEEHEGSICTGSIFHQEGIWYAFYATRLPDRSEHVGLAMSKDGVSFTKTNPNPLASPQPPYKYGPFRDPHVFQDPDTGQYHMLVTAEVEKPSLGSRGGCLAHLVSEDLIHWEQREPFLMTGYADQPECSEHFFWRGWYYLAFSHFGVAHYRMSRHPMGPWQKPLVDTLDGPLARVMKSAEFVGGRRLGAFFLDKGNGYAGYSVFREILQNPDGTLATRWPTEMVPPTGGAVAVRFRMLTGEGELSGGRLRLTAPNGMSAAVCAGIPKDALFRFRVTPHGRVQSYGVAIRGGDSFGDLTLLEFDPDRRKVGWRPSCAASWREFEAASLYEVEGLHEPLQFELVALGDVLDVCIDNRRTLINRNALGAGDRLYVYCQNGEITFDSVEVRPILREPDLPSS